MPVPRKPYSIACTILTAAILVCDVVVDRITLSHGDQVHVCQVTWLGKNVFTLKPIGGKGNIEYQRHDVAWDITEVGKE